MKKKLIFSLCFIMLLSLTSCTFLEQLTCEHEYEFSSRVESTCSKAGYELSKCDKCGKEKKTRLPLLEHEFDKSVVEQTCTTPGYTNYVCSRCGYNYTDNKVDALGHSFNEWVIISEPSDLKDGVKERVCSVCNFSEQEYILSTSYIDLTYVKEPFNIGVVYKCDNFDELSYIFNLAVVNLSNTLTCNVYEFEDFNTLLKQLIDNCDVSYSYSVDASLSGRLLTINFNYIAEPTLKTSNIAYVQYQSLNYNPITKSRSDDYDSFEINNSLYTFNVKTTDQLHYALERGVKPIIKEGSNAQLVYEKAKMVLRQIISDDMNDFQKVKAIHDWLVMNVVYDDELLKLLPTGQTNLQNYNGFYLEGVFLDNKAVCEGISKAFTVMCNIEGIPCVTIEGYQTQNPSGPGHAWNKVYVDGKWYIVDVTSDGTIISNTFEVLSYKYFLVKEEDYKVRYTQKNSDTIECNNTYDIYSNMMFSYKQNTYDYVITSQSELNMLVGYFYSNTNTNYTVEFKLAFDYGDSILDEIKSAYSANHLYSSYSYIDNGNIFMLIKK